MEKNYKANRKTMKLVDYYWNFHHSYKQLDGENCAFTKIVTNKKMSFNCNCCGRFGHWSKTCLGPYEEVFKIHAQQQTNLVEDRND